MSNKIKVKVENLNLYYGENHALKDVNMDIQENAVTAFIGPSGCGKSTFLKTLNRMNDLVDGVRIDGKVLLDGEDIYDPSVDTTILRKKVGMVFQQPNPFPKSIYDNIAYGPRLFGVHKKAELDIIVEKALKQAAIWDEVKDRLKKSALGLSGGQQQRTALARCLINEPDILLLDEPFSALDTWLKEQLLADLKQLLTYYDKDVLLVTHNRDEAYQLCQHIIVLEDGHVDSAGTVQDIFSAPPTRAAAVLTGCRNMAPARLMGGDVFVPDWNLRFHPDRPAPPDLCAVAIREQSFMYLMIDILSIRQQQGSSN